jgi:hypothetical protein
MAALILRAYNKRGTIRTGTINPDVPGQPSLAGTVLQTMVACNFVVPELGERRGTCRVFLLHRH